MTATVIITPALPQVAFAAPSEEKPDTWLADAQDWAPADDSVPPAIPADSLPELGRTGQFTLASDRTGVALRQPTDVRATGAELSWSAYTDPSQARADDITAYQVHRATREDFTPSAATLVATLGKRRTSFTDTSAETTPGDGRTYHYMVAVRTRDGKLVPAATRRAVLPAAEMTYFAPETPARMIPGDTYTTDVTLTNTSAETWPAGKRTLSYHWSLPDGKDVSTLLNQAHTRLPGDLAPGDSVTVEAEIKTPTALDLGTEREDYVLTWDVYDKATLSWLSKSDDIPGLAQGVVVEDPTSDQLGMEKFFSYTGRNTGAGSSVMDNLYSGNAVWQYNAFTNPGRGLGTFVRFAYNSLDTSDTVLGPGWSAQTSGPVRLGASLEFQPKLLPHKVILPDGDGTSHVFEKRKDGTWEAPAGVHYLLEEKKGKHCLPLHEEDLDAWSLTRPDRTRFFFDCHGYLSSIVDKNGNTLTFTYDERPSLGRNTKFLRSITDAAGRETLRIDYFDKGESYEYIDDKGEKRSEDKLLNPHIVNHVRSMTDVSGRELTFVYTEKGRLAELTDGAGSAQPKVFAFGYDQHDLKHKLVKVTDPRGHATELAYREWKPGEDPDLHGTLKTFTDRLGNDTRFASTDPDGHKGSDRQTVVTDSEDNPTTYRIDGYGRTTRVTNAKSQVTKLSWDADNNVSRLEEDNGAVTTWAYDPKTGYPLEQKDAEAHKNDTEPQRLQYRTGLDGHVADLWRRVSPEGRTWQFGHDERGNLTSVTDPRGVATEAPDDYTSTYAYDEHGQQTGVTDANGHTTRNSDFGPTGYPGTITDPLGNSSAYVYDERGNVLEFVDELGKKTTQTYDVYGRTLVATVPKDQDAGDTITTPAPEYDENDNVTRRQAPNGAVTTAVYDAADRMTESTAPRDTDSSPERRWTYTYDSVGNLLRTVEPKGNLTAEDGDYTTTNAYDEIYQLIRVTNAEGDRIGYSYDDVGNAVKVVDPNKNATEDPDDYASRTTYDLNHRVTEVLDATGRITAKFTYDKDSLTLSRTDAAGATTYMAYDARSALIETRVPHARGDDGEITHRTTRHEYDQVGNPTRTVSPRGVETPDDDKDFVTETVYDELNRPKQNIQPYDPDDPRHSTPVSTFTRYDKAGRVSQVSAPPSEGQSVRNDTDYTYYDNGWVRSATDPWDIATRYDYDELGNQKARSLTSAGGSSSRTMGWTYYPDGKLRSRTDDGVPVGLHVALVDNSDSQHTVSTGTWASADKRGQQGYDHRVHAAGAGDDSFTWNLTIPQDGTYEVYAKYPEVEDASDAATYEITHRSGSSTKTIDQSKDAGTWVSLGSYAFTRTEAARLKLAQSEAGAVAADGVKLVRDTGGETDDEKKTFRYTYDANGNMTELSDNSVSAAIDTYRSEFTELNQLRKLDELDSGETKKSISYTYDPNGQTLTQAHTDQRSAYTYDPRGLVTRVSVGTGPDDPDPEVTTFTHTERGETLREVKANGNTVDHAYFLDGALRSQVEKKADGTVVSEHTLAYDANGNTARDATRKMNADDHSAYLDSTTEYSYDPANRLSRSVKTGTGAGTETYVHDDNANVISQTVKGETTTYRYDRNRLQSSATSGTTFAYNYDPYGRQNTVTAEGRVVERTAYDGFDHVVESSRLNESGSMDTTEYAFDPLDRTTSKTRGGEKTDYQYLGLSGEVLNETVAGEIQQSYQYSPWGSRLSQLKETGDDAGELTTYSYNARGDVETIADSDGDTKATYGYTAYGKDDESEFTGIDKPEAGNPDKEAYNPFRFSAKRWDAASQTYDMGFRDYSPGLNRFVTRDTYNGALEDLQLATDPLTGNRYAFTGGNPVSRVELDGHFFGDLLDDVADGIKAAAEWAREPAKFVSKRNPVGLGLDIVGSIFGFESPTDMAIDTVVDAITAPSLEEQLRPAVEALGRLNRLKEQQEERCSKESSADSWIIYSNLDSENRATGAVACLAPYTAEKQDERAPVDPVGWEKDANMERSHLIAREFGGNNLRPNIIPMHKEANDPGMRDVERDVRARLDRGERVFYTVVPIYAPGRTRPLGVLTYVNSRSGSSTSFVPSGLVG
ncbi:golvesin C-terminal-like domain-containing protein [Streptomyces sp. 4N124]|uniref:golvesin C-terminal-like domain-containing protein n=1 Tax=Streptomyces sp. 4N124 TaxID=3457420 RepID=UPI003FCFB4C2